MNDFYIHIESWMIKDCKLSSNDLVIFAMIHGYSNGPQGEFVGSLRYIQERLDISKTTVVKAIKNLISKRFIC